MKRFLAAIALFVAAFIVFLIATVPARFALQYLPAGSPLQLTGVEGSIWRGRAAQASWQGRPVGQLAWQLHPLPLLLGRASADVELVGDGYEARGHVVAHRDQSLVVSNATVSADLARLPLPATLMATPGGRADAKIRHARIENRWPVELDADLNWSPARLLAPFEIDLGKAALTLTGQGDKIDAALRSEGNLQSKGRLSLSRNGRFDARLRVAPTEQTPQELRDMLPMLGRPDSQGAVTVRQTLQLRGFPP